MAKINTTGELREFLANMIMGVKDGTLDVAAAREIKGLASEIHDSFYSEIKVARVRKDLAGAEMHDIGNLEINGTKAH